jgi:LmbE family N-acetylglucosaminyl deacetylase
MMVTEDGGASWSYRPLPDTEWLRAVWANAGGKVVLAGEREKVLISEDHGWTWEPSRGGYPKADILGMLAHGDDAAINLNAFYAYYAINENKTIVDLGALSDVHSSEYEETYNLEHDRNMWMIGVRTSTNFNEFETGNNGSDYYHFTERLWEGEENAIRHMVAAIRAYRPEIVITHGGVFGDYDKPGHKLSGRAGLPAFERAGGEVDHYPELTRLGLKPWQPKKLYHLASESYPETLDLTSVGGAQLKGTDSTCLEFGEYVIRNFQSQGVYHARNGKLSLVKSLVPVPEQEESVFDGLE